MNSKRFFKFFSGLFSAMLIAALMFAAMPIGRAQAAGIVTTCDESSFNTALSGGGLVTFQCSGTIAITGVKNITSNTVIEVASGYIVTLDGNNHTPPPPFTRIFNVSAGVSLTLRNITIQDVNITAGSGGAVNITNGGMLVIENSRIINNSVPVDGAAIYARSVAGTPVTISISNSLFSGNIAGANGGAINIGGVSGAVAILEIENSIFANNQADTTDSVADGGAIHAGGYVTINSEGSLFSGNQSGDDGGAIFAAVANNIVNLANNTFSSNSGANNPAGDSVGGALALGGITANIVLNTFYNNQLINTSTNAGSAIHRVNPTGMTLRDNIFSANTTGGTVRECFPATYGNNNRTDDGSCNAGTTPAPVTNFNTTLQNNGGPTSTHALQTGSNAIDAASACTYASSGTNNLFTNGANITIDQRGAARPYNSTCDKGAYEVRQSITQGTCGTGSLLSGVQTFAFSANRTVTIDVTSTTDLRCIRVEEMRSAHLAGNAGIQLSNNWWLITGDGSDFTANMTLPASYVPDSGDQVCRFANASWTCGASAMTGTSITWNGITAFSDWAIFEDQTPTAITLAAFNARAVLPWLVGVLALGLLAGGVFLVFSQSKRQNS